MWLRIETWEEICLYSLERHVSRWSGHAGRVEDGRLVKTVYDKRYVGRRYTAKQMDELLRTRGIQTTMVDDRVQQRRYNGGGGRQERRLVSPEDATHPGESHKSDATVWKSTFTRTFIEEAYE